MEEERSQTNLFLVGMSGTPVPNGYKVDIFCIRELHLINISDTLNEEWVLSQTWLFMQLPGPYREVELTRNGEMVRTRKLNGVILKEN